MNWWLWLWFAVIPGNIGGGVGVPTGTGTQPYGPHAYVVGCYYWG